MESVSVLKRRLRSSIIGISYTQNIQKIDFHLDDKLPRAFKRCLPMADLPGMKKE